MPLELATGIIRVRIDRDSLRAQIKSVRAEIIRGLSGIRVRVDIDRAYARRAAAAAGREAGSAFNQSFRNAARGGAGPTGMVPISPLRTTPAGSGRFGPAGLLGGPAPIPLGGGQYLLTGPTRNIGTTFGGRSPRMLGGAPFVPRGFLGGPAAPASGGGGGGSPWAWAAGMYGGMPSGIIGGGGGGGGMRPPRFNRPGGRGFFGQGPFGRFVGGAAFQMNPLLALSAHYGGVAGGAGALTAMAGSAAIQTYADFENQMNWVKFLQREQGATAEEVGALEAQARHLGRTTMFSATEAANAQAVLTKRGFNAGQVKTQMPNVLNLAAAGEMDIGEAADAVASAMQQFNLTATDTRMIVDVLAKASLASASDVKSLANALSYVGPIAHQTGMSFRETVAAISLMEDGGLKASRAGTGLARVLAKLADRKTDKVFQEMGVDIKDANGAMRDMDAITKDITERLKGMSPLERVGFVTGVFRERGGLAMSTLLSQMDEYKDRLKEIEQYEGTAQRAQEERLKSLTNSWKNLKDAAADVGIALGDAFGPSLTWQMKTVAAGMNEIMDAIRWIRDNPLPWQWPGKFREMDLEREIQRNLPVTGSAAPVAGDVEPAPGRPMGESGLGAGIRGDRRPGVFSSGARAFGEDRWLYRKNRREQKDFERSMQNLEDYRKWSGMLRYGHFGAAADMLFEGSAVGLGPVPAPGSQPFTGNTDLFLRPVPGLPPGTVAAPSARGKGYRAPGGEFRPEIMGIEELHRNIQLGVLDKKDKWAEQTADNTKKTSDGIAELNKKNFGGYV